MILVGTGVEKNSEDAIAMGIGAQFCGVFEIKAEKIG